MHRRRLVSALLVVALLGAVGAIAPEIYTATFSDLDTFGRVAGLVAVLTVWVVLARRFVPDRRAGLLVAATPVVVIVGALTWPYLRPATEVDEAFPPVRAAPATTVTDPVDTPTTAPPAPDPTSTAPTSAPTTAAPTTSAPPTPTTTAAEPVELARSGFQGLAGHRGSGEAAVYRLADESILLRFEAVDIGSGPDLEVYVVPGADQRGLGGGHHVASLTAERGNQNYTPPATIDLTSGTWTVLVWCETFAVEIANATLVF